MAPPPPPPSGFNFSFPPSLEPYNLSLSAYLPTRSRNLPVPLKYAATGALVFNSQNKILLIQRAPHDSMPLKWEIPGGAIDEEDLTVLYGLARELWEEAGLLLKKVVRVVNLGEEPDVFFTRSGRLVEKVSFEVEVEDTEKVRLDPEEHVNFCWVGEEECRGGGTEEGMELEFSTVRQRAVVCRGFELRRGEGEKGE
ncbi:NUDIX hydrolase domain-like protein [Podospora fimiseda]|uniref:NUDIX hydrolase domain-like protein n=1 Tax=Podospora fimiseda TaxID=252190 RepID=A0AAN7H562_9PEZI|nr:NUDIX hydrolase domain-like protein [Podospora fimiseda]